MIYRQGDVLIIEVQDRPAELRRARTRGLLVLAAGEVTGHAHVLDGSAASLHVDRSGRRYVRITERTKLRHEEHAPVTLLPGWYEVRHQREYSGRYGHPGIWPSHGDVVRD